MFDKYLTVIKPAYMLQLSNCAPKLALLTLYLFMRAFGRINKENNVFFFSLYLLTLYNSLGVCL